MEALRRYVIAAKTRLNREITAPRVRLIDETGAQAGIVSITEALERAAVAGFDLAEIAPQADPPVAKILDWGKFRYEQTKQLQKNRKSQKATEVKQVRLGLKIGEHDLLVKAKKARIFIEQGNKVKLGLRFKGREITHPELGKVVLNRFAEHLADIASVEQTYQMSGREMNIILGAKKESKKEPSSDAKNEDSQGDGKAN